MEEGVTDVLEGRGSHDSATEESLPAEKEPLDSAKSWLEAAAKHYRQREGEIADDNDERKIEFRYQAESYATSLANIDRAYSGDDAVRLGEFISDCAKAEKIRQDAIRTNGEKPNFVDPITYQVAGLKPPAFLLKEG